MPVNEDIYLRELCMLTGKVSKDRSYLYYLLIKDGEYFNNQNTHYETIKSENAVDDFESWFNKI